MSGLDWCPGCHAERSEISAIESAHLIPKFTLMQRFTESLLKIRLEGARTTKRYFKHWAESDLGSGIALSSLTESFLRVKLSNMVIDGFPR